MSIQSQSFNPAIQRGGIVRSYPRKGEIVHEGDHANHVYEVVSGTVCTSKILREGRRQIAGFYFAGDMFGLESTLKHTVGAQAITDAKVRIIKKQTLNALASSDCTVADRLLAHMTRELARRQDHSLLLSRNAQDRMIGFIFDMARRAPLDNDRIALPYRQDIADYLGLTLETVSRTLNKFERRGAIKIKGQCSITLRSQAVNGKAKIDRLLRAFEGINGRLPKTEQEFEDWLASREGKVATVFELTSFSLWGESGRS